ncbi:hypothetical protein GGS23DRAFT_563804 [Durotheca rogersii]|uniref:uncharacterized protein n=1 Tax=Durotheca rogersii TaxID=419775 RepID=UPI00221E90F9|nr:uncharacterized protein GGS23DRAFT_563804 [Durotheca rogersii]KAI5864311.1 hypothetical protein GGS23DRAFT_563804 [Durotheca rogersii]
MERPTNPEESAKRKARVRADIDASVDKLTDDVNATVGGPPSDDASKEDWNSYMNLFMGEIGRRDAERARQSWNQLAKANKCVDNMRKRLFSMVGSGEQEDESFKGPADGPTNTAPNKSQGDRSRPARSQGVELGPLAVSLDSHPQKDATEVKHTRPSEQERALTRDQAARVLETLSDPSTFMEESTETPPPRNVLDYAETAIVGQQSPPSRKRRRNGVENLESNLGTKWEAHVDEEGHRPSRKGRNP